MREPCIVLPALLARADWLRQEVPSLSDQRVLIEVQSRRDDGAAAGRRRRLQHLGRRLARRRPQAR